MPDDTIKTISIGLGLDVAQLDKDIRDARTRLREQLKDRSFTVKPLIGSVSSRQIDIAVKQIGRQVQAQMDRATTITPKFTVTKTAVTQFRGAIEKELARSPILIPVDFRPVTKSAVDAARRDIEAMWNESPIRVPLTWYWKDGPPPSDMGGPAGGGGGGRGPASGGGPAGGGGGVAADLGALGDRIANIERAVTGATPSRPTRAERSAANKANWAANRAAARGSTAAPRAENVVAAPAAAPAAPPAPTMEAPAPLSRAPRARRTTGQAAARPARTPRGTPAAPPAQPPAGERPFVSVDTLRAGRGEQYTPWDLMAQEAEKAEGTFARPRPTRGARTGSRASNFVSGTPQEIQRAQAPLTPAERQLRDQMWERHEAIAQHMDKIANANARRNDPAWQRARAISNAIRSVKRDPYSGLPDTSEMEELLSSRFGISGARLAGGYQALLAGRTDEARAAVGQAFEKFGAESGLRKGRRRLLRALDPTSAAFNKQPADVQMFGELGGAIRAQASVDANPDVVLKRRTVTGRKLGPSHYSRGAGLTKTGFDTDKMGFEEDEAGIVTRGGRYMRERLKKETPTFRETAEGKLTTTEEALADRAAAQGKGYEEPGVQEVYTTGGRKLRLKVDPETGAKTVIGEFDEQTKARRRLDERKLAQHLAEQAAAKDYNAGRTPSQFGAGEVDPSLRPSPLPGADRATFSDATGRPEFTGRTGRPRPPRPTPGPHARNTEWEAGREEREKAYKQFFSGEFFKRFSERMRPPASAVGETPAGLEEKLAAMALLGNSPNEQQIALNMMRDRGYTGRFGKDDLARLKAMGLNIEGLAEGGPVKSRLIAKTLFSRPFGESVGAGPNVARANSYEWKKLRGQQIRKQPFCTNCGIGRAEAKATGNWLTADHVISQAHGGDPWDPDNLQTLCKSCNSSKGHLSQRISNYTKARKWKRPTEGRADGGPVNKDRDYVAEQLEEPWRKSSREARALKRLHDEALRANRLDDRVFTNSIGMNAQSVAWKRAARWGDRSAPDASQPHWFRGFLVRQGGLNPKDNAAGGNVGGGGLLERLLAATLEPGGAIRPGMEERSQELNRLITLKRGGTASGVYRTGERGPELYQSKSGRYDRLVGVGGEEIFFPPEDGEIVPNHKLPGRAPGGPVFHGTRGQIIEPYRGRTQGWVKGFGEIQRVYVVNAAEIGRAMGPPMERAETPEPAVSRTTPSRAETPVAETEVPVGETGATTSPRRGKPTPLAKSEAKDIALSRTSEFDERLVAARTEVAEALQKAPARALSVMFGQIAQTMIGGRADILTRRNEALAAIGRASTRTTYLRGLEEQRSTVGIQREEAEAGIGVPRGMDQEEYVKQLTESEEELTKAIDFQTEKVGESTKQAEEAAKKVLTPGQMVRSAGVGLLGIMGGTVAFTAAMHLAQVAISVFSDVAEKSADALSGFALTTQKVTQQLAQSVREGGGGPAAAGVIAGRAGALGLPAGANIAPLVERARLEAGNLNMSDAVDMIRASMGVRNQVNRLGRGAVPGLTQTTGGLFGTPLFGTASTAEIMSGVLAGPADVGNQLWMNALGGLLNGQVFAPGYWEGQKALAESMMSANEEWFDNFNGYAEKAGDQYGQILQGQGQAAVDATLQAWQDAGLNLAQATRMTAGGRALAGMGTDRLANRQTALTYLEGVNIGSGMPTREFLIDSMRRQIAGQMAGIEINAQRSRDQLIPTAIAMQLRKSPFLAPGTGLLGRPVEGATFGPATSMIPGLAQGAASNIAAVTSAVADSQAEIRAAARAGEEWLSGLSAEAQAAVRQVSELGSEIAAISQVQANMQAQMQTEQMNRQMELQLRNVGDALGMAGELQRTVQATVGYDDQGNKILGEILVRRTEMGRLQRQQMLLSREQTAIELRQQQRQINFGLALAQIGVPGESPAERAANLAYNRQVALEQQQALDRQTQMFEISKAIQEEGIRLDVSDAVKQLQELSQSDAMTLKMQGLDAVKQGLTDVQQFIAGPLSDSWVSTAQQIEQTSLDAWLAVETQMGSFNETYRDTIDQGIADLSSKYADFLSALNGTGTGPQYPLVPPSEQGGPGGSYATGAWTIPYDQVAKLHRGEMVVPSHVANWMRATVPSGGGGGTITININNPTVRNDNDIELIAQRVEQVMNRRAISVGLGT